MAEKNLAKNMPIERVRFPSINVGLCLSCDSQSPTIMLQANNVAYRKPSQDTLPEWSKGVDSSSTSASCAGSNPAGVRFSLCLSLSSRTARGSRSIMARLRPRCHVMKAGLIQDGQTNTPNRLRLIFGARRYRGRRLRKHRSWVALGTLRGSESRSVGPRQNIQGRSDSDSLFADRVSPLVSLQKEQRKKRKVLGSNPSGGFFAVWRCG